MAFALATDTVKVPKLLEMSSRYKAIVGDTHPKHFIDISCKNKKAVRNILDGNDKDYKKISLTSKAKMMLMPFQGTQCGVPPSEIVAASPQSNNE